MPTTPLSLVNRLMGVEAWTDPVAFAAGSTIGGSAPSLGTTVNTAITTAGAGALTAAAIVGRLVTRSGPSGAYTDTVATAALIVAAVPGAVAGQSFILHVKNTVAFPQTLATATGITLSGTIIVPPLSTGIFLVTLTTVTASAEAVAIVGLGSQRLTNLPAAQYTTAALSSSTAAAGQLTGADVVVMNNSGATPGNYTTRTGAQMFGDIPNCQIGFSYLLVLCNGQGTGTLTLTAADGTVTITGTATVAINVFRVYVVTITSATTVTIQNVGSGVAP